MELREYVRILRHQWLLIVACLLLGIAAAALVTVRTTPQYSSTARLFVTTPTPTSSDANASAYQGGLFSQQRVASYADLIKGTTIAQKVIDRLQLDETATALSQQITARAVPNTVILEVTVTDPSAARAHQLAQTLAEVFTAYVPQLEGASSPSSAPIKAVISDAAVLPTHPVSPRPVVNIGLGAVLGLLVGLGLATLREKLDTKIRTTDDLHRVTGAALLGIVHYDSGAASRPLVTDLESHSPRRESFRVLRTNLQFVDVDEQSKLFAVTSPLPGDGKSTTAINLSITLAQAGRHTLLLEADLRRPRVAEYLRLEPMVGLTTVLIGLAGIDDVIQPFGRAAGLDVITNGPIPPNPAELLQSTAMKMLLAELRTRYDVIIIDAPPILPVTDAALLASIADGAILVVHHGRTTRDQAVQARQRLESVEAKLLGTVMNFVPSRGADRYGYGYEYGYAATMGSTAVTDVAPWAGRLPRDAAADPLSAKTERVEVVPTAPFGNGDAQSGPGAEAAREGGKHNGQVDGPVRRGTVHRNLPR
ncbi:MAG: polysaccharide biosynthesis tyrosine autokinase [Nakamurella sp.]